MTNDLGLDRAPIKILTLIFSPLYVRPPIAQPDDLCIDIWISVMIISQHPDSREVGHSNVLVSHPRDTRLAFYNEGQK